MTSNLGRTRMTLSAPLSGIDLSVRKSSFTLDQEFNTHDVGLVCLPGFQPAHAARVFAYGTPLRVNYGGAGRQTNLYAYVTSSEAYSSGNTSGTRLTVISAGMPLKARRQRVFRDMSATMIAQIIADDAGLAFDGEPHRRVFSQVSQSGQSDWEVLTDLASRIGYSVRVEGVTLQFVSRERLSLHYRALAPLVSAPAFDTRQIFDRQVIEFTPIGGEHQQEYGDRLANHRVTVVDPSGRTLEVTAAGVSSSPRDVTRPLYDAFHTAESAQSVAEAMFMVQGYAEANRYPIKAHALLWGDADLQPNRVLRLTGLARQFSGYWTVLRARHCLEGGSNYRTEVILGTEGLDGAPPETALTGTQVPIAGLLKSPYPGASLNQGIHGANVARGITVVDGGPRWVPTA